VKQQAGCAEGDECGGEYGGETAAVEKDGGGDGGDEME
jgi:hypothetical protein